MRFPALFTRYQLVCLLCKHITFCWAILFAGTFACSGKSFHALRYIPSPVAATSMRLPFGIIHHSIRFPTWMPEKISGLRAKRKQRQPDVLKALSLHTFSMPVIRSPFVRWFYSDFRVMINTGNHRKVWSLSFFLYFPVYTFLHIRLRAGKQCGVNRFTEAKVYPCSSRRCKFRPFGFCRKSPRLCFAPGCIFCKKPDIG